MTLRNSTEIARELLEQEGLGPFGIAGGQRVERYMAWAIDRARESDRTAQPEVVYAHAGDWEVSTANDEAGLWVYLQVYRPLDPSDMDRDDPPPVASVSMSDVEAHDLVDELLEAIAALRLRSS